MQVNENGVISFEEPWGFSLPERFPTSNFFARQGMAIAPFWSDNDIRSEGRVTYISYSCNGDAFGTCQEPQTGNNMLTMANDYINEVLESEERFVGTWLLVAHWQNVHPSPHGDPVPGIPQEELDKVLC